MIKAAKGWDYELGVLESWCGYAGLPPKRRRAGTVVRPEPQCYTIHSVPPYDWVNGAAVHSRRTVDAGRGIGRRECDDSERDRGDRPDHERA